MSADLREVEPGSLIAEYCTGVITREMLAQYAAASGDLNPLHLDAAFARKAGFDDVIAHGMLGMALLGRLLTGHFPAERLCNFSARFVGTVAVGETLQCRATLASADVGSALLSLEALTSTGTLAITGSARVLMT